LGEEPKTRKVLKSYYIIPLARTGIRDSIAQTFVQGETRGEKREELEGNKKIPKSPHLLSGG
jgi:hypothetical protein